MPRTTAKPTEYRVRFVFDEGAGFEECNGESRPLTETEYAENQYFSCPDHPRAGTQVLDLGGNGKPQIQGCAICKRTDYQPIPYAEYRAYYGNPENHVYLGCIVEKACPYCGAWESAESLWSIDFMTDDREYLRLAIDQVMTPAVALGIGGYVSEVARELLTEAGWREGER